MPLYTKESLELLRQKVDLVEIVSSYVPLKKSGASYKGLCPFHEEKTPSFILQKGDSHYHCFGCGAHGDAIAFLMSLQKLSFIDAVETLAERFSVSLEEESEKQISTGPSKKQLRDALEKACRFYHFILLYSEEGRSALKYLYERELGLEFLTRFQIGYAPSNGELLLSVLEEQGVSVAIMEAAGLINARQKDFFSERITFPIRDGMGNVIGFSGRKFREETFGGKYINTAETLLFKKSQVLFGLSYSRQKIAKERCAIVVEGQVDALRLIHAGFDYTVAGQGTAFGELHVKELVHLGASKIILALDGDLAGKEAAIKIGDLFQKKGIEVRVLVFPEGDDPDSLIRKQGVSFFTELLGRAIDYLPFVFQHLATDCDLRIPSKKAQLIEQIAEKVRAWESPVLIHESLKKLAKLAEIPIEIIGSSASPLLAPRPSEKLFLTDIHPDRIMEIDLLRWLVLMGASEPELISLVRLNMAVDSFRNPICRSFYVHILQAVEEKKTFDLFSLGSSFEDPDEQKLLAEILVKKINLQKAREGTIEAIHRLLLHSWMEKREAIKNQIQSGKCSDSEALELAKEFDALKKNAPQVKQL